MFCELNMPLTNKYSILVHVISNCSNWFENSFYASVKNVRLLTLSLISGFSTFKL